MTDKPILAAVPREELKAYWIETGQDMKCSFEEFLEQMRKSGIVEKEETHHD